MRLCPSRFLLAEPRRTLAAPRSRVPLRGYVLAVVLWSFFSALSGFLCVGLALGAFAFVSSVHGFLQPLLWRELCRQPEAAALIAIETAVVERQEFNAETSDPTVWGLQQFDDLTTYVRL